MRVQYRPVRFGWCVETGNWSQFESALRWTHTLAGGHRNPIIPVDQPALAEALIDRFRVDALFPVEDVAGVRSFIDKHKHLHWPGDLGRERLYYEQWQDRPASPQFADVTNAAVALRNEHFERGKEPPFSLTLFECQGADPLGRLLLATFGGYPAAPERGPDYCRRLEAIVGLKRLQVNANAAVPGNDGMLTPAELCRYGLDSLGDPDSHGFFLGSVADFADLLCYWNLRAAGIELCFIDLAHIGRFENLVTQQQEWLKSLPKRPWDNDGRTTDVWTTHLGQVPTLPKELALERPMFHMGAGGETIWNGLNTNPGHLFWNEHPVLGSVDTSEARPSVAFQLPPKPFGDDVIFQRMVATISGADRVGRSANSTFLPPYVPELNEYYGRELHFSYDTARADSGLVGPAVSIVIRASEDQLTLRALPASDLIHRLFRAFGIHSKVSQPGLVTARLIDQMGSLQDCRVFKIEGVRDLIRSRTPDQHFDRSVANKIIGRYDESSRAMRFEPFESLYISPRPHGTKLQPQDALNELLEKGVLRVGLELKCPKCQLLFWQHLDGLATKVDCAYCGNGFDITLQLKDRQWAYRRSGLFGHRDDQHGGIPVALTLQQLDTELMSNGILYTTSLELSSQGAAIAPCETDFAILTTGPSTRRRDPVPQLLIGECKSPGGTVTPEDAKHLGKVADTFPPNRVEVFIVFSKTGTFSDAEVDACAEAQGRWTSRVILLSKDELEPYHIFDRRPDNEPRIPGLEGMADHMVALYPALRPKGLVESERARAGTIK